MTTHDYHTKSIAPGELHDLKAIADVRISDIRPGDHPDLLVFPGSLQGHDPDFGKKTVCNLVNGDTAISTNSIVGFIGRNSTRLSIHSRFADDGKEDYFLHYMLQKVARINLFSLRHTSDVDSVFDFLLYLFPSYLKKAVRQGLYKQYVTRRYNDGKAKGVVDADRHIRHNVPFNGKVAYTVREYSHDNDMTRLIRHTIATISRCPCGQDVLNTDADTRLAVSQIIDATPGFSDGNVRAVINSNLRPSVHPYFSEYAPLQRLCLQILRHEELKYGQEEDEIYGVLIDAAWLWEEYLALLLEGKYVHCLKDEGPRYHLFDGFQQIIPDYLSLDRSLVADAKYIPLDRQRQYGEEKATSIYYKTITYMYRFCCHRAFLLYPHPDTEARPCHLKIKTETEGINGGAITKLGLRIPSGCTSFGEFMRRMKYNEQAFLSQL